jgi:hypothetical protein
MEPPAMKLGIVGTGNVGNAIALAAVTRGSAREIVLVNRTRKTAQAVATDLRYGTPLTPKVDVIDGDYADLAGCGVVLITSGVNEKTGGATDRNDPHGRLKLLDKNAGIYRDIVPQIVRAAPEAVLVAVTDPPDPLADIAREAAGHDRIHSRASRTPFRRRPRASGGAGDRRPRHLAGVPVVIGAHCRRASDAAPGETGREAGGGAGAARKGRPLRQHHHHRRP